MLSNQFQRRPSLNPCTHPPPNSPGLCENYQPCAQPPARANRDLSCWAQVLVNQFERRIQDMTKEMKEMKEQFEQVPSP